jgi:hypothetical protein
LEIEVRGWTQADSATTTAAFARWARWLRDRLEQRRRSVLNVGNRPPRHRGLLPRFPDGLSNFNNDVAESADEVTFLLRWRAEEIRDGR